MGKSLIRLWEESKLVWLVQRAVGKLSGGIKAEGHGGQSMQSLVGRVEEVGLYYKSSRNHRQV